MPRRKYYFDRNFKVFNRKQAKELLEYEVFSSKRFNEHIKEVSVKLHIDPEIIKDVLQSYFLNIFMVINTARKVKTKINIYAFFSLLVQKGKRV